MSVSGGGGPLSSPVGNVGECTSLSYEAAVPVGASSRHLRRFFFLEPLPPAPAVTRLLFLFLFPEMTAK